MIKVIIRSRQSGAPSLAWATRTIGMSLLAGWLKNSYSMSRATNLECADNGGALDFLAFSWSANPKRRRATLADALQISFSAPSQVPGSEFNL